MSTGGQAPRFCSYCGSSLAGLTAAPGGSIKTRDQLDRTQPLPRRDPAESQSELKTLMRDSTQKNHDDPADSLPPKSFVGPFQIVKTLGQGGMGTVYEAVHSNSNRTVALKLLSRSVKSTEETIQRFQRESQIAASINHPRSTFVYQAGQHQGQFYITMELMTGGTLTDVVGQEGAIPVDRAVDYVLDIISGLQAAHHAGIVHRDLKPSNCFLDEHGRVKIGDFGLAKSFMSASNLTQTGAFMGTPQFAAPEQLRASDVDARADIYAIGGTLFYLLTGRPPFVGNAAQVIASIASDKPPRVNTIAKHVPDELSRVIHQTLEKDPARRPENLEELRQALLPYSTRGASSADPGRRMAAFFVDLVIISMLIAFASQIMGMLAAAMSLKDFHQVFFITIFLVFFVSVAYFAIQESRWGTTVGKWLLGMRVISEGNQKPALMPSIIRATMVAGLSYVANALPAYALNFNPTTFVESDNKVWTVIWMQLFQMLSWLPILLCFVTARRSNGFQGFHEIISGTRVVRLSGALEYKRPKNVPVTTPVAFQTRRTIGGFEAIGQLGQLPDQGSAVLLGRDVSLERDVWMVEFASAQDAEDWDFRKTISRPCRLRVIAEDLSVAENGRRELHWVVTEAVKGMPLADYVRQTPDFDWRSFRPLLRELVYELAQGQTDGTLPKQLELQSVWVDQTGGTKLLDQPLLPINASGNDVPSLTSFQLITALLDAFIENQVVPAHVLTFRRELDVLKTEPDTLRQIGQRLGELADKPSAWRWDDRLGVLAVSSGIEFSTGISVLVIAALIGAFVFEMAWLPIALLTSCGASLAALILGAVFGGGPVFRISGVLVRKNKTLEPASPFRCAVRNWFAWLPLIAMGTCLAVVIQQQLLLESQTQSNAMIDDKTVIIVCMLAFLPLMLVVMFGAIYSLLRPFRGLADVISGTRLIRK
jgi:uncharacterized RDD family membrane protein YckC